MFGIIPAMTAIFSFLGGIAPAVSGYFQTKANVEATEFSAMTAAQQAEYTAAMKAQSDLNSAKVTNNNSTFSHIMIAGFAIPPMIYLGVFYISAGIPALGWHVDPLKGDQGTKLFETAITIALSYFVYGAAQATLVPVFSSLASRIRG